MLSIYNHLLFYQTKDPVALERRANEIIGEIFDFGEVLDIVQIVNVPKGFLLLLTIDPSNRRS